MHEEGLEEGREKGAPSEAVVDDGGPRRFPLVTWSPVRPAFLFLFGAVLILPTAGVLVAVFFTPGGIARVMGEPGALVSMVAFGVAGLWLLVRGFVVVHARRLPPPVVVVTEHEVRVPPWWPGRPLVPVPLEELTSVELRARAGRPIVVLSTRRRLYAWPGALFVRGDEHAVALVKLLRASILARPGGKEQIAAFDRRTEAFIGAMRGRPIATLAALFVVAAFYLVEVSRGAPEEPWALLGLGANAPALVQAGEVWRLFAANALHASGAHLWMNMLSLVFLGAVVERLLGRTRFVVVLLASALAGALVSAALSTSVLSVGASTGIFGLFGTLVVLQLRFGAEVPAGFRQTASWWALVVGGNLVLPFAIPNLDVWAHVGGFFAGFAITALLVGRTFRPGLPPPVGLPLRLLAATLLAAQVGSVAVGLTSPEEDPEQAIERLLIAELDRAEPRARDLVRVAQALAAAPRASRSELERALTAVARARGLSDDDRARDTHASLLYRLGEPAAAAAIVLDGGALTTPRGASQLARFARAASPDGPLVVGEGPKVSAEPGLELHLHLEGPAEGGVLVLAEVRVGEGRPGYALITLPGPVTGNVVIQKPVRERAPLPGNATLHALLVDVGSCHCTESTAKLFAPDPAVARLPSP